MTQQNKTIVMLRTLSADEKTKQEAYYREKRLHDEASALSSARAEGLAEGRAELTETTSSSRNGAKRATPTSRSGNYCHNKIIDTTNLFES